MVTYLNKVDKRLIAALENVIEDFCAWFAKLSVGVWHKLRHVVFIEELGLSLAFR